MWHCTMTAPLALTRWTCLLDMCICEPGGTVWLSLSCFADRDLLTQNLVRQPHNL